MPLSTVRPDVERGDAEPGTWCERDRLMAVALTLHEQRLCSGCGHPSSVTHSMDKLGEFEVRKSTCLACEALEKDRRAADQSDAKSVPGEKTYVVDVGSGD